MRCGLFWVKINWKVPTFFESSSHRLGSGCRRSYHVAWMNHFIFDHRHMETTTRYCCHLSGSTVSQVLWAKIMGSTSRTWQIFCSTTSKDKDIIFKCSKKCWKLNWNPLKSLEVISETDLRIAYYSNMKGNSRFDMNLVDLVHDFTNEISPQCLIGAGKYLPYVLFVPKLEIGKLKKKWMNGITERMKKFKDLR